MEEGVPVGEHSTGTRKRRKSGTSKRKREQENRYTDKDPDMLQFEPPCNHKEGRYRCCSIPAFYLIQQRKRVLNHHDKLQQDRLLGSMMSVSVPKRRRPRKDGEKLNSMFIRYQVRVHDETLPIC
ncbi:hypothetical protein ANN_02879 [Periplaneta americana]|uniref:Uncharacterized protein n=1 Tax=Periplaneta americana TaxID=6978 RepID=A0ABQ8TZ68_PERAM|nr:hypothetical protein ANN_02879 [Periplaneta americana]